MTETLDQSPDSSSSREDLESPCQQFKFSLENSDDDDLVTEYFNKEPNLNDCSFHLMCAQASGYPDQGKNLLFEDL